MAISTRYLLLTLSLVGLTCVFMVFLGYTHLFFFVLQIAYVTYLKLKWTSLSNVLITCIIRIDIFLKL